MRQCGDCTLCCKLLPMVDGKDPAHKQKVREAVEKMVEFGIAPAAYFANMVEEVAKPAGVPCPFQRFHKGCTVYARRPFGCRTWNCRWLVEEAGETGRPDRVHYVIDIVPDVVRIDHEDGPVDIEVIQVWCDPKHPDSHRDPALRAYLLARAAEGKAALIRYSAYDGFVLAAPPFTESDEWEEQRSNMKAFTRKGIDPNPDNWTPRP